MLHPSEIEAIVGGYHGDAFRVLGPHPMERPGATAASEPVECWEVRAFLPQAREAWVVLAGSGRVAAMARKHSQGLFCASLDGGIEPYRLRYTPWEGDGAPIEIDDPYRFPLLLTGFDLHLHGEGSFYESYNTMGAHLVNCEGVPGVRFAVWAPNAEVVTVVGEFNDWDTRRHPMRRRDGGIWELFLPNVGEGTCYKYNVKGRTMGYQQLKADPYAFYAEKPPKTASVVYDLQGYEWGDAEWMRERASGDALAKPMSIYEVHLESWMRHPNHDPLSYRELADTLLAYVVQMGYTHIELLPVMEHPFSGSWGYQVIGYYAPTSRFGTPKDFMYFVDRCHQAGVGVIVDWVPAHYPKDAHGLAYFDGTALYEHADPRRGEHRDWGTLIFNYGRNEVRTFLISNGLFWLKQFHIDGLRVDAVASMLYLDYSREPGEWIPNQFGGRENLEAIEFLKQFNIEAHKIPGAVTMAEESTSYSGVSRPVHLGGLGFTMKWNMGWMHDMLHYFAADPIHRRYRQNEITFSLMYAFTENFVLPISHDEVVHLKRSLLSKMPGDEWRQFANARAFLSYMWTHPGKKLLFMGCDVGQREEWNYAGSVRWDVLAFGYHAGLQETVRALNEVYRATPALYEVDYHWSGFEWVDFADHENSVISFLRISQDRRQKVLVVGNFTPVPRFGYRIGVPEPGEWREIFNSDAAQFAGSNLGNGGMVRADEIRQHNRPYSLPLVLPPLGVLIFRWDAPADAGPVIDVEDGAVDTDVRTS